MFPQYMNKNNNYRSDSSDENSENSDIIDCEILSLRGSEDGEPDDFDYAKFYTEMYEKQFGKFDNFNNPNMNVDGFEYDLDLPKYSLFDDDPKPSKSNNSNINFNNIKQIYNDWKDSSKITNKPQNTTNVPSYYPYVSSTSIHWKKFNGKIQINTENEFDIDVFMDQEMTNVIGNISVDESNKAPKILPKIELGNKEHFHHSIIRYIILNQQKFHSLFQETIQELFPETYNPDINKMNSDLYEKYMVNILNEEYRGKMRTETILFRALIQTILYIQDISFIYFTKLADKDNNINIEWVNNNINTGFYNHTLVESPELFILLSKIAICIYYLDINQLYPDKTNILQLAYYFAISN